MADISDEEFFKQRGFGLRIGYGGRPALIIIDMINAFTDKDMPLGAPLEDQIEAIEPLLEAAHERDLPVYFSTVAYEYDDLRDAGIWGMKMKGSETLRAGTESVEVGKPSTSITTATISCDPDVLNYAWRDFGVRVGVWRLAPDGGYGEAWHQGHRGP